MVETFRALDALSSAEADAWRRRFEAAGAEPAATRRSGADADTRRRADEFIGAFFEEQRAGPAGSPERRAAAFRGAVFALEAVGAAPTDEAYRWIRRLHTALGLPTGEKEAERERARACTARDLRAVIPAPIVIGDLQVSHLELYADGALLFSYVHQPPGGRQQEEPPLAVSDDLGTVYEPRQYHGFAKALAPAVPDGASRLEISYGREVGEISLR